MKNQFQTRAFWFARELAEKLHLAASPLDTGNGIEYKNYLNHTIFTIYSENLDGSNKSAVELAIGDYNISEEYNIPQARTIDWIDGCVKEFAHPARSKLPQNWKRLSIHNETEFRKFSETFVNYLESSTEISREPTRPVRTVPQAEPDKKAMQEIWARRGQAKFRESLLAAYGNTCAVTECIETEVLEAAHIVPYSEERTYEESNGILLRADIHTLFDLFLISIDPQTGNVVVANRLSEEYQQLNGRKARLPSNPNSMPNFEALMAHKRKVAQ